MSNHKCTKCRHPMKVGHESVRWDALPTVVLANVEIDRCPTCGEYVITYPKLEALGEIVARAVVAKQGRLSGPEVRFLRSFLDLDGAELADAIGSNPSTISKWERDHQPIGRHADLLIRALVLLQIGEATMPSYFAAIAKDVAPEQPYRFEFTDGKWSSTEIDKVAATKPATKRKATKATRAAGPRRARHVAV